MIGVGVEAVEVGVVARPNTRRPASLVWCWVSVCVVSKGHHHGREAFRWVTWMCGGVVQAIMLDTRLTGVVLPGVGPDTPLSPKRGVKCGGWVLRYPKSQDER